MAFAPSLALAGVVAAAAFGAGFHAGGEWARGRQALASAALRETAEARNTALRGAEMLRLGHEDELGLALGKVIADAEELDSGRIVFDADRVGRLFARGAAGGGP